MILYKVTYTRTSLKHGTQEDYAYFLDKYFIDPTIGAWESEHYSYKTLRIERDNYHLSAWTWIYTGTNHGTHYRNLNQ